MLKLGCYPLLVAAGTVLALSSVPSVAQTYTFSVARTCIQGNSAFNNVTLANPGATQIRSFSEEGTIVLNAGGTGTATITSLQIRLEPGSLAAGQQAINVATTNCNIAHTTLASGDLKLNYQNCTYTVTKGRGVGDTGTLSGQVLRVRKTLNGEVLLLSTFNPVAQEVITYTLPAPGGTVRRICNRTGTAILR